MWNGTAVPSELVYPPEVDFGDPNRLPSRTDDFLAIRRSSFGEPNFVAGVKYKEDFSSCINIFRRI